MKFAAFTLFMALVLAGCTPKSSEEKSATVGNKGAADASPTAYAGWGAEKVTLPTLDKCPAVHCDAVTHPSWWADFEAACVKDGFKMVKADCCGATACSGLPTKPSDKMSEIAKADDDKPCDESNGADSSCVPTTIDETEKTDKPTTTDMDNNGIINGKYVGKKLYKSFKDQGLEYKGVMASSCETAECSFIPKPRDWTEFEAACKKGGYEIIKTSCCETYACTGLPKP
jgi:hypothetical protein